MKKTNSGIRCGEVEDEKFDAEQYDDTGLYLGKSGYNSPVQLIRTFYFISYCSHIIDLLLEYGYRYATNSC